MKEQYEKSMTLEQYIYKNYGFSLTEEQRRNATAKWIKNHYSEQIKESKK